MLYRVSTCCLGLLDHQIFLQSRTYGTSLDHNNSVIHKQHYSSLYLLTKCNSHGTPSHKLTSDTCTTQCMHVSMLAFKILAATPVIIVPAIHIGNGSSRAYFNL
ncbi:hypothetical protein AVEN_94843-1 [Araneus ventricosus]|uniref:Uncharacterized protein n=1 Tax=Araneus ventricosus TaxID=182803 RepID=A0A4Y2CMJ8_ARAVE|nr:hypothetical protein AVEN_94843-1 [Araneus ventricosus]